jgi:NAD+ kinase
MMAMPDVLFVNAEGRPAAMELAERTSEILRDRAVASSTVDLAGDPTHAATQLEGIQTDLIVSLGGDGTFLRCARLAHQLDIPILGLNFGRVGYLLEHPPSDLASPISEILDGRGHLEDRSVISLHLSHEGRTRNVVVINEATIERTLPGHTVRVKAAVDGNSFLEYAADGVVVASPMGSTAYNLSAGGPIVMPQLDVLIVTPVAPHLTVDRSLVVEGSQSIELTISGERPAICVVDGVGIATLEHGECVVLRRHERKLRVASVAQTPAVSRLRAGLRQSHE